MPRWHMPSNNAQIYLWSKQLIACRVGVEGEDVVMTNDTQGINTQVDTLNAGEVQSYMLSTSICKSRFICMLQNQNQQIAIDFEKEDIAVLRCTTHKW